MKTPSGFAFAAPVALILGACSSGMMDDGSASMRSALIEAQAENSRHSRACDQADTMPRMLDELERHQATMAPLMQRMSDARNQMGDCSGGSPTILSQSLSTIRSSMSEDDQRMRSAASVDAARTECHAHANSMATTMQGMMGSVSGMSCMGS